MRENANATFFVAVGGSDDWSGKLPEPNAAGTDGPFATLHRTRDAVRPLLKQGKSEASEPVLVLVRGGKYFLQQTLDLTEEDSGTADVPVTYAAFPGETPVISGGRRVGDWQPYRDGIYRCELPETRGGRLYFRQLFADGQRQVRARYPKPDAACGRWNGRWARSRLDDDAMQSSTPYIIWDEPDAFRRPWAKPTQGEVFLMPSQTMWGDSCLIRIKSVDPNNGIIHLAHGMRNFDVNPMYFHRRINRPECAQFIVENLLEELTEPGEWCLDTEDGMLYFRPPHDRAIEDMEIVVPVLKRLVHMEGASHLRLSGLVFTEARGGEPSSHYDDVDGVGAMRPQIGWEYCGEALYLSRCTCCAIENCRICNAGGNGIYLRSHNDRNRIRRNEIHDIGANGVVLAGGRHTLYHKCGGTPGTPHPVFNEITDNTIHHIGLVDTYAAGVFLGLSNWNRVAHNDIHDVPHHAVNLGNSRYGRNYIEYNRISRAGSVTSDNAAINCWHELPPEVEPPGHVIRGNFISDTGNRDKAGVGHCTYSMGIYLDNWSSNCLVEGNVIVNTQPEGKGIAILVKGHNNIVENNILVDSGMCHLHVCDHCCYEEFAAVVARNIFYDALGTASPAFDLACRDHPRKVLLQCDWNLFYEADGDDPLIVKDARFSGWSGVGGDEDGYDVHSVVADPLFLDAANGDYRLRPESPAFKLGFREIDLDRIGVRRDQ
ncbi:right-handed parallel beta-helix repeat-containing protein [Verrucomicrobiota bacterium]